MRRTTDSRRNGDLGRVVEGWWSDYARSLRRRRRSERTIGAYRRSFEDFLWFQLAQDLDDPAKLTLGRPVGVGEGVGSVHEFRMHGGDDGQLQYLAGWKSTAMPARYGRSAAGRRVRKAHQAIGLGDRI